MRILLVNPPAMEPYGPYPAITFLAGFLETIGRHASLADANLALTLKLFSRASVDEMARRLRAGAAPADPAVRHFLGRADRYADTIEVAVRCLQGGDHGADALAARRGFFPPPLDERQSAASTAYFNVLAHEADLGALTAAQKARAFASGDPLAFAFGHHSQTDAARFVAHRVVADVASVVRKALDPEFHLGEYGARLMRGSATFGPIAARLAGPPTFVDELIDAVADELSTGHAPDVVGLSVPFENCAYGAFRMAHRLRRTRPSVRIVLGGGWVNTELRHLSDPSVFDVVDAITLDDGERPLQCFLEYVEGARDRRLLKRTFVRESGAVVMHDGAPEGDVPMAALGAPTYAGLALERYLNRTEPAQPLWGRRWNKLLLAHGCYWKKCAFCDTGLDYIARYQPAALDGLIASIRRQIAETGETGFHFVDEAMPPALVLRLADRLIAEHVRIAWWGNVRFDAAFAAMAETLAAAGCIGITAGLEVASDRVLALMAKGISLAQTAAVCRALTRAGIFVHAYLIYGFPTQTTQETVDALEYIRQMFAAGYLNSAVWHSFSLTRFSPIAADPARYGITIKHRPLDPFVNYELDYDEPNAAPHASFGPPLDRALQHYRLGVRLERPVQEWFADAGIAVPPSTLPPDFVERA